MELYIPQYFTLDELTKTDYRYSRNVPDFRSVENLSVLCQFLLDPLRQQINRPIVVSSGYRSEEVNRIVGGVCNSLHLFGKAADISCRTIPPKELFSIIKDNFVFTELGLYYSFVHVAYDPSNLACETFVKVDHK